jgi:hypothetical protein
VLDVSLINNGGCLDLAIDHLQDRGVDVTFVVHEPHLREAVFSVVLPVVSIIYSGIVFQQLRIGLLDFVHGVWEGLYIFVLVEISVGVLHGCTLEVFEMLEEVMVD